MTEFEKSNERSTIALRLNPKFHLYVWRRSRRRLSPSLVQRAVLVPASTTSVREFVLLRVRPRCRGSRLLTRMIRATIGEIGEATFSQRSQLNRLLRPTASARFARRSELKDVSRLLASARL